MNGEISRVDHPRYGTGFQWEETAGRSREVIRAGVMYGYGDCGPAGDDFGEALFTFLSWWEDRHKHYGNDQFAASDLQNILFPDESEIDG